MLFVLLSSLFLLIFPLQFFFFFIINKNAKIRNTLSSSSSSSTINLPKSYPIIGMAPSMYANRDRRFQWISKILMSSPSRTFVLRYPLGRLQIITSNPSNVQHILKTKFHIYSKGDFSKQNLSDFLGHGIFNVDGENWKFQRQVSSHEFNSKSLRKFIQTVVDTELSNRLIPILSAAAADETILDFQDILQRFAFDNVCKIAFDYDPEYLTPSLPQARFAEAFEECVRASNMRFSAVLQTVWKVKRFLSIGSEKNLKKSISEVRKFAKNVVRAKKRELENKTSIESSDDLLSRFLSSGHSDEDFMTDVVINFILAGRDTTSAALTWFFWLVSRYSNVEDEILKEIEGKSESMEFDEVKDMPYTHASLCESMRLYPPVPRDTKEAIDDDVLPDGTVVKKGTRVTYHPYAMGRSEELWGSDWSVFKPERWLEEDAIAGQWRFVGKDAYTYPVFQAGPRICLGKEMAFLQMKRVVAGVLRRFRVVPVAAEGGSEPIFISDVTSKMKGGFAVRIEERIEKM